MMNNNKKDESNYLAWYSLDGGQIRIYFAPHTLECHIEYTNRVTFYKWEVCRARRIKLGESRKTQSRIRRISLFLLFSFIC